MSKDQFDTHLRFGQGLLIEGYEAEGDRDKGLLTAKGYADIKCRYQTYEDILFFQNYRDAIFQIIPAGNFEIHDQILKSISSPQVVEKLKQRADNEKQQFKTTITKKMKEQIYFGMDVMFRHLDSDCFLSGTISPSEGDNGAFAVILSNQLSSNLIFKLMPVRSFQFEGMIIPFGSPVTILNKKNQTFLTYEKFGRRQLRRRLQQNPVLSKQSFQIPIKSKSKASKIYNAVSYSNDLSLTSTKTKPTQMPWKFKLHMVDVINDKLIQHDIGYLQHTENGGVLTAFKKEVALKQSKNPTGNLEFYDCLWEIEKHEGENQYIFRHLMSGMTLDFVDKEIDNQVVTVPVLCEIAQGQKLGSVDMVIAKKQGGQIGSDSFVFLRKGQKCLSIAKQRKVQNIQCMEEIEQKSFVGREFATKAESELNYLKRDMQLTQQIPTHCFTIMEIDDETKGEVLFALSFHQTLINLIDELRWGPVWAQQKIKYSRMIIISKSLKQIKAFLKKCSEQEAEKEQNLPTKKRQEICKDLGMSQLLFELLYYMKINKADKIFQHSPNQLQKFEELYQVCYQVIEIMIKNNYLFKLHVSKWIDFVIQDVIQNDKPARLLALKEILRGNLLVVSDCISQANIQFLVDKYVSSVSKEKYIQIFSLLCKVNDIAIQHNQINILNHLVLKSQQTLKTFQNKFMNQQQLKLNISRRSESVKKSRRKQLSYQEIEQPYASTSNFRSEDPTSYSYYKQYFLLLSNLCYGRNKHTKDFLKQHYRLEQLLRLIKNPQIGTVEVALLNLINYLHVQGETLYPIIKINNIYVFDKMQFELPINSADSQHKPWDNPAITQLQQYLIAQLKYYNQTKKTRIEEYIVQQEGNDSYLLMSKEQNIKLNAILETLLMTVQLGYWRTLAQFKQMIAQLEIILTNDYELIKKIIQAKNHGSLEADLLQKYQSIKEILNSLTTENMLFVKCKNMACTIILKILDYEVDSRVSSICKIFIMMTLTLNGKNGDQLPSIAEFKKKLQSGVISFNEDIIQPWIECLQTIQNPKELYFSDQINLILIQLSQYKSYPSLISQALQIMKRLYDQRNECIKNFEKIVFVESGKYLELSNFTLKRRSKFYTLLDQSTLKAEEGQQIVGYHNLLKQSKDQKQSGLMQDMFILSELMKNEKSIEKLEQVKTLQESGIYGLLCTDRLINLTNERQTNNKFYQKIIKSSKIHELVLKYIESCVEIPQSKLSAKLLHLCYIFMTGIITNNQENKSEVSHYYQICKSHIHHNIGALDFLKQMYDNNKNMLYNLPEIQILTTQICDIINEIDSANIYRAKLLDFFRCLVYFNEKALSDNQILILKIMQDDDYKHILLNIDNEILQRLLSQYSQSNHSQKNIQQNIKISSELTYMYCFFQTLSVMIEDKNVVNLGKLYKKYPFKVLVDWIELSKQCWPLRRNIRMFLNKLYYVNPGLEFYLGIILDKELDNLVFDLRRYVEIVKSQDFVKYEQQKLENPIRFSYMVTYFYLNLEECLNSLYELLQNQKILNQLNMLKLQYKKVSDEFAKNNKYQSKANENIKRNYESLMDKVYQITQQLNVLKKIYRQTHNKYTLNLIKYIQFLFKKIIQQQDMKKQDSTKVIETHENENLLALLKRIFTKKKRYGTGDSNIDSNKNMIKIIAFMKLSTNFRNYTERQFISIVESFSAIDSQSIARYKVPYVSLQHFLSTIIQVYTQNPNVLTSQLKIFVLRLITRLILPAKNEEKQKQKKQQQKKQQQPKQQQKKEEQGEQEETKKIQEQQTRLNKCGLSKFLCSLLSEDICSNIQLANQILSCCIAYLNDGYEPSQRGIAELIQNDQNNTVFVNVSNLISKLGNLIYMNNKKKGLDENSKRNFSTTTIDTFDHYDSAYKCAMRMNVFEPDDSKQEQFKRICMQAYRRCFKFIQLLCQNNNENNKHLIRQQKFKNEQGQLTDFKKLNSISFIEVATNELRQLFSIMCKQIVEIPEFILQFLLEVTQIPIKQNQKVLMKSTFFEDLYQMENFFSNNILNLSSRNFEPDSLDDLNNIYGIVVSIILSNFQGNDQQTFRQLDNKLEAKFLTDIIDTKLKQLKITSFEQLEGYISNQKDFRFNQQVLSLLDVLTVFKKMKNANEEGNIYQRYLQYREADPEKKRILQYFQASLLQIEIAYNNKTQILFFPNHPVFSSLSGGLRDQIMANAERSGRRDKLISLYQSFDSVKEHIEHSYRLQKDQLINQIKAKKIKNISSLIAVIITLVLMFNFQVLNQFQTSYFVGHTFSRYLVKTLSLLQVSFGFYYAYLWYKCRVDKDPINTIKAGLQIIIVLGISLVGTFWQKPQLFTIHLLDIFSEKDELKDIFLAIGSNLKELCLVSLLGVFFVIIFNTVTFSNYMKNVYEGQTDVNQMCSSLYNCIIDLYISGVIGQTMEDFQLQRFNYDLVYTVFFGMLFESIISGLMLDAFANSRDAKEQLKMDKENFCYICNISRQDVEKERQNFQTHITSNHFLWNYVFYLYILKSKNPTDYTGLQYYISKKVSQGMQQVDWFPNCEGSSFDAKQATNNLVVSVNEFKSHYDQENAEVLKMNSDFNKKYKEVFGI